MRVNPNPLLTKSKKLILDFVNKFVLNVKDNPPNINPIGILQIIAKAGSGKTTFVKDVIGPICKKAGISMVHLKCNKAVESLYNEISQQFLAYVGTE